VLARAAAASPLRLLTPRNHGDGAWVYLATFGGGLVDGDHLEVHLDAEPDTTCMLGTQASTKVYRSPRGCSQRLEARVAQGAAIAILPDPVVCFEQARYSQQIDVSLESGASLLLLDGYSCGRSARGERWRFGAFCSRTTIARAGVRAFVDATRLDPAHGSLPDRMGRFDAILSLVAMGPRFSSVADVMQDAATTAPSNRAVVAVSRLAPDATLIRVAAECFEDASRPLRASFSALANVLGDDPFARKW
jgi:urease accessory protein